MASSRAIHRTHNNRGTLTPRKDVTIKWLSCVVYRFFRTPPGDRCGVRMATWLQMDRALNSFLGLDGACMSRGLGSTAVREQLERRVLSENTESSRGVCQGTIGDRELLFPSWLPCLLPRLWYLSQLSEYSFCRHLFSSPPLASLVPCMSSREVGEQITTDHPCR
jgi:hypothetical protein